MRGHRYRLIEVLPAAGVAIALAASGSPSRAQDQGRCVTARVEEAYALPDGTIHPAGRLTLCVIQAFTPVVGLHRIDVGDDGGRMAMSRRASAEEYEGNLAQILFHRLPDGGLQLAGYVLPIGGSALRYAFKTSAPVPRADGAFGLAWAPVPPADVRLAAAATR